MFLAMAALIIFIGPANAEEIYQGDTVPAGTTIENDVILNGTDILVAGNISGDLLAVGNNITIDGNVGGSAILIGQNITLNGQVSGSVYTLSVSLELGEASLIDRSLYYAGVQFASKQGSKISWDMNGVMLSARLGGSVGRDTKAMIGILEIVRFFMDTRTGFTAVPTTSPAVVQLAPETKSSKLILNTTTGRTHQAKTIPAAVPARQTEEASSPAANWAIELLRQLVMFLIVGGIMAWLWPNLLNDWAGVVPQRPLPALGNGIVFYIVGFIASLFFVFLVLAAGLGLFRIQLGELAWITWGIGFSGVGLGFWLLIVLVSFGSKVIVSYTGGLLIFERVFPQAAGRKVWPMLAGLVIYLLVMGIPYLGWIISMLVTWLGMGAVLIVYRKRGVDQVEAAITADRDREETAVSDPPLPFD